jgi:hypothetical protein
MGWRRIEQGGPIGSPFSLRAAQQFADQALSHHKRAELIDPVGHPAQPVRQVLEQYPGEARIAPDEIPKQGLGKASHEGRLERHDAG